MCIYIYICPDTAKHQSKPLRSDIAPALGLGDYISDIALVPGYNPIHIYIYINSIYRHKCIF